MRILITGGAGYLGSILSRKLLEKNYQVRVMDALWYGIEPIKDCLKNDNFELILVSSTKKSIDSFVSKNNISHYIPSRCNS